MQDPYIDGHGVLVIPFDSDPKYHWWAGGQRPEITREEIESGHIVSNPINSINPVLDVVRDRDVPFDGAYSTRKNTKDRVHQSVNLAGDNLLLF